jgi:hypothetical protein
MPVRGRPQEPMFAFGSSSSAECMWRGSTVMLPVTSPRPKYCTSTGPSLRSARRWSARYIGAPA